MSIFNDVVNERHREDVVFRDVTDSVSQYYIQSVYDKVDLRAHFRSLVSSRDNSWFEYSLPEQMQIRSENGVWALTDTPETVRDHVFAVHIQQNALPEGYEGDDDQGKAMLRALSKGADFWTAPKYSQLTTLYGRDSEWTGVLLELMLYLAADGRPLGSVICKDVEGMDEEVLMRMHVYPVWLLVDKPFVDMKVTEEKDHPDRDPDGAGRSTPGDDSCG